MLRAAARIFVSLWLLGGAMAAGAHAQEPARLALLIGNRDYDPSVGVLKNPHNDITLVGEALTRQGFTVLPPIKDATRVQILSAMRDFARRLNQAGSGAVGFLYYSGHGASESGTNVNYLIPIDAQKPGSESFWDQSVNLDEVLKLLGNAGAAAKFVVFDACRNELRLPYRGSKGFVPVREQPGIFVAYTTAPGQPASDDGERGGPYASALAAELTKPGLDHLSLFQNVKKSVYSATNGAQSPWESNGLIRRVYLTAPKAPSAQPQAPDADAEAAREWAAVDKSSTAMLRTFLLRHGGSRYAAYAQARLEELGGGQPASGSGAGSSWWQWPSGQRTEPEKPKDTQPVAIPAKPPGAEKDTQVAVVVPKTPPAIAPNRRACDGLLVAVAMGKKPCIKPGSGESFRDCPNCPEMVIAPSGRFIMGSPKKGPEHQNDETQHEVRIAKPFAVGRFAVTFAEWGACVADGGCGGYRPADEGWGRDDRPVINVSWDDAKLYVQWLSKKTGKQYRLLSEAEREYVARAGTTTPFWWGSSITPEQANYDGNYTYNGGSKGGYRQKTLPVKSFKPNPWGLYQVHGNVYDWVEDCYHDNYNGVPSDGSAWIAGECKYRVLRGGSWSLIPQYLRAAYRDLNSPVYLSIGFRVALGWQDLNR